MSPEIQKLIDVAILMAQELQEFVDDAIDAVEGGYQEDPLQATQELLKDCEAAYAASGLSEADHFIEERAAAAAIGWHFPNGNDDLANMPAPGQKVILFYESEDGSHTGPVISTPIHADGSHRFADGAHVYRPCVKWHALPGESGTA